MRARTKTELLEATRGHRARQLLSAASLSASRPNEVPNGTLIRVDHKFISARRRTRVTTCDSDTLIGGHTQESNSNHDDSHNSTTPVRTQFAHDTNRISHASLGHLLFISTSLLCLAQFITPNAAIQQQTDKRAVLVSESAYSRLMSGNGLFGSPFPSARHFYHSARSVTTSAPTSRPNVAQLRKRDRINSLHEQLNQLRRRLETELRVSAGTDGGGGGEQNDANISNQTAAEASEKTHPVELGAPCLSSTDCAKSIRNSHCSAANFTCVCLDQHVPINASTCLAPSLLGYECQLDAQCQQKVAHSLCVANKCACEPHLFVAHRKDKCLAASKLSDFCLSDAQCQLNDRYSYCKWKIPNVYGTCKCPPNYKILTAATNSTSPTTTTSKCAPRLGDACLGDADCQLATSNALCRSPSASSVASSVANKALVVQLAARKFAPSWPTSSVSSSRCTCAEGFVWSASQLECEAVATTEPPPPPPPTTTTTTTTTTSASNLAQDSHKYEMIVIPASGEQQAAAGQSTHSSGTTTTTGSQLNDDEQQLVDIKILNSAARTPAPLSLPSTRTSQQPPITTSTTSLTLNNTERASWANQTTMRPAATKLRMSSLGKTCESRAECQLRDPHSDCIEGRCECQMPTAKCSANSTGCHKDTFQCRNGQCISWYFVCDQFANCDDASDELDCQPNECPRESFQCHSSGSCVARAKVCDGKRDCPDASDELHCQPDASSSSSNSEPANFIIDRNNFFLNHTLNSTTLASRPNEDHDHQQQQQADDWLATRATSRCHPDAFTCRDGRQCLPAYVFCNAVVDCADASDEDELMCERPRAQRKWLDHLERQVANSKPATSSSHLDPITTLDVVKQQQQQQPIELLRLPPVVNQAAHNKQQTANSRPATGVDEESPLVKTDRASIERLRAALALANRTPESRGRQRTLEQRRPQQPPPQQQRRAKLLNEQSTRRPPDECPRWAFTCTNGKCRSSAILCSGVDGCGDNSDEDRCEVCHCQAPAT